MKTVLVIFLIKTVLALRTCFKNLVGTSCRYFDLKYTLSMQENKCLTIYNENGKPFLNPFGFLALLI